MSETKSVVLSELIKKSNQINDVLDVVSEAEKKATYTRKSTTTINEGEVAYSEFPTYVKDTYGYQLLGWKWDGSLPDFGIKVFDVNSWPEIVQKFIPKYNPKQPHYFPDEFYDVVWGITRGYNVACRGKPGSGKTTGIKNFCALTGIPYARVNCSEGTTEDKFFGKNALQDGDTVPIYSPASLLAKHGGIMALEEWEMALQGVLVALLPAMEHPRYFDLSELLIGSEEQFIECNENFSMVMCSNTGGLGDMYGDYGGVNAQNKAVLDRIDIMKEFEYLPFNQEFTLLRHSYPDIDDKQLELIIRFGSALRNAFQKRDVSLPWSVRGLKTLCNGFLHYGDIKRTFKRLLSDKYSNENESIAVQTILDEILGT